MITSSRTGGTTAKVRQVALKIYLIITLIPDDL
jgi:hypothetical protein